MRRLRSQEQLLRMILLWSSVGILLGTLAFLSPGSVFMAFLVAGAVFLLARYSDRKNRRFLLVLFLSAFMVRVGVSTGLDLLSWKIEGELPYQDGPVQGWNLHINDKTRGYLKIGDSDYFSQRGYATAQFVEGSDEPVLAFRISQYGEHGYVYGIGWFYHLFGFSPCAVKLINCLFGSGIAVLVVLLGERCFGTVPGRWAGVLAAVFPSMVLWSTTNLKDIPLTFFTTLILFLYSQLFRARNRRSRLVLLLLLLVSLGIHMTFRSVELSILLAALLLVLYFLTRFIRAHPVWTGCLLLALLALGTALSFREPVGYQIRQVLGQLFNWHVGFNMTPGSSYKYLPDEFYRGTYRLEWVETGRMNSAILLGMGWAVLHYLFEPFPWNISNWFQWLAYPQLLIWYALFPFAVTGLILGLRKKQEITLALVLTTIAFVGIGALAHGNIGTLFRQRDMVTPLFLIIGCAGLHRIVRQSYWQGSRFLGLLSRFFGSMCQRLECTVQRIAQALGNGPMGQSLRDAPLRSVGIMGIAVLATRKLLLSVHGQTSTSWMETAGAMLGTVALLALFHRGNWRQVAEGSWILRFLQRS